MYSGFWILNAPPNYMWGRLGPYWKVVTPLGGVVKTEWGLFVFWSNLPFLLSRHSLGNETSWCQVTRICDSISPLYIKFLTGFIREKEQFYIHNQLSGQGNFQKVWSRFILHQHCSKSLIWCRASLCSFMAEKKAKLFQESIFIYQGAGLSGLS